MGRHVPGCRPIDRKFFWVLVFVFLAWPGGASAESWRNYTNPYELPVVAIPEGGGIEHFFGSWGSLNSQFLGIEGAMTIGPEHIEYANYARTYDEFYKVLRVTSEYAVLVVHYKNPVRVGSLTLFKLLTLRRDPKDGEILLFFGYRHDFRVIDQPLTHPLDFYRQLLDNPDEEVLPPYSGPWGQWAFTVYEPYKN